MKITKVMVRVALAAGIVCCLLWSLAKAAPPEINSNIPPVLQGGFALWTKGGGIDGVLNLWQKGGLMEGDNKVATQASYFRRINQVLGNYRSNEVLQTKAIGRNSEILYLGINFERGALYARFMLFRTDKDWVVQNMDFSTRPEALMPWLAFEGEKSIE